MKRVLTLCLYAALLLSLAACGSAPEVTLPAPDAHADPDPGAHAGADAKRR